MIQPWIVAVLSTDYDLEDERKAIISFLHSHNVRVSAFEEPDSPIFENLHSHDNCLQILKRADFAILLVNRRYGGKYYLTKDISITEAEFSQLERPAIVLINERTWNERNSYRKQVKEAEKKGKQAEYVPAYVDDINVFSFIDNIQNRYFNEGKSNWINFWKDIHELTDKLPYWMQALSINIIERIRLEQKKEIKAKKTSTAFSMSLGDVIERGYYIEPEYEALSGQFKKTRHVSNDINNMLSSNESCMIIAEAGAGKTTLLAKTFLERVNNSKDPFDLPVYIWLKGKGKAFSFSIEDSLRDSCEKYLHRNYYPFFNVSDFRFCFFLDGFDELMEKLTKDDLHNIYSSEMFQWPIILTSRIQYAKKYMVSNEFASKFSYQIRIKEWSMGTSQRYIDHFCNVQKKDETFRQELKKLLTDNPDMRDILNNPLLVTVLLYVIENSVVDIPETVTSRVTLLKECIELLAQREIDTKVSNIYPIPTNEALVLYWAYFAWNIYKEKLGGNNGILLGEAQERINTNYEIGEVISWPQTIYDVIFDVINGVAVGTFHEQFLEYLVAYVLTHACETKSQPYPDFLKYVMRPEINRYFRGIVGKKTESDKNKIIDNIVEQYMKCAGLQDKDAIAIRVHAVYHLSRISNEKGLFDRIFNIEKELAVLQSLYFGAIKRGDMQKEQELYDLLTSDEKYSNANRGYHLAYYDALLGQKELPYNDDSSCDWNGTLNAFQRHFESTDIQHFYLRRIDLVTMRQLMLFRNSVKPLTEEILMKFCNKVYQPLYKDDSFQHKIEQEYKEVEKTYNKLKNN